MIGCEDRLRSDLGPLYCVEWGVKLYSNQPTNQAMRANRQRDRRTLIAILRSPTAQFLTLLCRRWAVWLVVNSCCEWHKTRPNVTVVALSVCVSVCCSRTRTVPNRLNQSRCRLECVDSVSGGACVTVNGFRTSRQHSVHAKEERPRTLRKNKTKRSTRRIRE